MTDRYYVNEKFLVFPKDHPLCQEEYVVAIRMISRHGCLLFTEGELKKLTEEIRRTRNDDRKMHALVRGLVASAEELVVDQENRRIMLTSRMRDRLIRNRCTKRGRIEPCELFGCKGYRLLVDREEEPCDENGLQKTFP